MNSLEAKRMILSLIPDIPAGMKGKLTETDNYISAKAKKIGSLLEQFPDLKTDAELVGRVVAFTKEKAGYGAMRSKKDLLMTLVCTIEKGFVAIRKEPLVPEQEMTALLRQIPQNVSRFLVDDGTLIIPKDLIIDTRELWDFIKEKKVKKLILQVQEGEITYGQIVLNKMAAFQPSLEDLRQKITVQFGFGADQVYVETKAKLKLCGEVLRTKLSGRWDMAKPVDLAGVTLKGFLGVLHGVETDQLHLDFIGAEYLSACDFLQYAPLLPAGIPGVEAWKMRYAQAAQKIAEIEAQEAAEKALLEGNQESISIAGEQKPAEVKKLTDREPFDLPYPPEEFFKDWFGACQVEEGKTRSETHMACYMPPGVYGKNLTLRHFIDLENRRLRIEQGGWNASISQAHVPNSSVFEQHKYAGCDILDVTIETGYWIMMLKKPAAITINEGFGSQSEKLKKLNYAVSSTLETCVCSKLKGLEASGVLVRCADMDYRGHALVKILKEQIEISENSDRAFTDVGMMGVRRYPIAKKDKE